MSSTSPPARYATGTQAIPARRTPDYPDGYSSTPGGTLYSTTPGGTRIVYDRNYLMNLRNSPISKTPPKWDNIPVCLQKGNSNAAAAAAAAAVRNHNSNRENTKKIATSNSCDDGELFPIDI